MITTLEVEPGIVQITILVTAYGQAGKHWQDVLDGPNHKGYGKIYIQRFGANARRRDHCYDLQGYYRGCAGANIDECPGAMFIWTTMKEADVLALDAIDNQKLGRDMGNALRKYPQTSESDLWQVRFRFV